MTTEPLRVGFCVSGGGRLFRAAVRHAEQCGIVPALLVADRNADPALEGFAEGAGVPLRRVTDGSSLGADLLRWTSEAGVELLVLTFDRIVPPEVVERFDGRAINVHPALLPAFKGMRAVDQALAAGARFAGATIHEVAVEVDAGPILGQCLVGVRRDDDAATLGARVFGPLRLLFLQTLRWYADGRVERDEAGRLHVRGAVYGELPTSPAVELAFPD